MKDKKNPLTPDEKKISRKGICLNTGRTHFKKGQIPWNAGKAGTYHFKKKRKNAPFTQERKDKASKLAKELGFGKWMIGKKASEEQKLKTSKLLKQRGDMGSWNIGRKHSLTTRKKRKTSLPRGERNHFWRGGVTPLTGILRSSFEGENWRKQVFKRDNYTCQDCGVRSGNGKKIYLEAHHKKPFAQILSEFLQEYNQFSPLEDKETLARIAINYRPFWDIDNGKTLCNDCHNLTKAGAKTNEG